MKKHALRAAREGLCNLRAIGTKTGRDRDVCGYGAAVLRVCGGQRRDQALARLAVVKHQGTFCPALLDRVVGARLSLLRVRGKDVVNPLSLQFVKFGRWNDRE